MNSEIITSNNNKKITIQTNNSSNISTKKNIENVNNRNINEKIDKILRYSQWNYKFSANSKILIIELNSLTLSFSDLINFLTLSELDLK